MLYEQCIWRLKCFLSIQVKKYLVYLFLASWEWFLQTSALQSASTEERLSGDFLLIKSCVYEFFGVDKKWPYETKNRYIGYFMNKIDRKHIVLQVKTKNVIRFPPLEKLLSLKVMKPSKTAVKTADRSHHFKRQCRRLFFLELALLNNPNELLFKFICILYKWESFCYWRANLLREKPFLGPKSGPFCSSTAVHNSKSLLP